MALRFILGGVTRQCLNSLEDHAPKVIQRICHVLVADECMYPAQHDLNSVNHIVDNTFRFV